MSKNCNSIIKGNEELIEDFEKNFEKQILRYNNEEDAFQYTSVIYSNLYDKINETITLLSKDKCTIIEKPILTKQLQELHRLFFDYLETSEHKSDYWKFFKKQELKFFTYKHGHINPFDFNKDYLLTNYVKPFTDKLNYRIKKEVKQTEEKITLDEDWLKVAYHFANGRIYDLYNNGKGLSFSDLNIEIFKQNPSDNYRHYIHHTLLGTTTKTNKQKNIFKRSKAEIELNKVLRYCEQEKTLVCDSFYEDCYKNEINIIKPS